MHGGSRSHHFYPGCPLLPSLLHSLYNTRIEHPAQFESSVLLLAYTVMPPVSGNYVFVCNSRIIDDLANLFKICLFTFEYHKSRFKMYINLNDSVVASLRVVSSYRPYRFKPNAL